MAAICACSAIKAAGPERSTRTAGTEYKLFGFGSTPVDYMWEDLPREILGEGIVLRVSGNTATLMITAVAAGDLCREITSKSSSKILIRI